MRVTRFDKNELDNRIECISVYDRDLRIIFWNKACTKKFSLGPKTATGRLLTELFPFIKNDYRVKCLREAALTGEKFFFPGLNYQYSGGVYTQLILPLYNDDADDSIGCINIVRDHLPLQKIPEDELYGILLRA